MKNKTSAPKKSPPKLLRLLRLFAANLLPLLLVTACTNPKPFHGGKATTVPTPAGLHQSISQGDNPSAPTKQTQTTVLTRTYALPSSLPSFPSVNHPVSTLPRFNDLTPIAMPQKRIPRSHDDIAADFFALRKNFVGGRWVFTESRKLHNPASHCDIAWAGALASEAHNLRRSGGLTSALA